MDKSKLRVKYKKIRNNVKEKLLKSYIISNKVIESDFYKKSKVIALYSSLPFEVDTNLLISKALTDGKIVAFPKVVDKNMMKFYSILNMEELEEVGTFGIKEPIEIEDKYVDKYDIDLMIIPGICFDRNKNRIGFGKGFYDKYLADARNTLKVGICFEEQVLKNDFIFTNEYDVKIDMVITDKECY